MSSYFFLNTENDVCDSSFIENIRDFAINNKIQIYIIDKPLADAKYEYTYKHAALLLIPKHKIQIIDFGDSRDGEFDEYFEDITEDITVIANKYEYVNIIGRPRNWNHLIVKTKFVDIMSLSITDLLNSPHACITEGIDFKRIDLLISLLIGSINDVERVKDSVPENILDKVKQKIQLFDGEQTRFIYQQLPKKRTTIQGLSGTGKTELLLHKLKDIYIKEPSSKLAFTCHNKILADYLRKRIPLFFNFLKVEQQIEWDKRLWCVNAWGNGAKPNSGIYSYICYYYGIPFQPYSYYTSFGTICEDALRMIKESNFPSENRYAFTYMFIDESQDFDESFFNLCEYVTEKKIYVAGDVFQSIFDEFNDSISPDFLLGKCYRTDPKTLMFAHALGMGLFEKKKLRWLQDREWQDCGYTIERDDTNLILSREPIKRFEDIDENYSSIDIKFGEYPFYEIIVSIISELIRDNQSIEPDDIGIIFLDSDPKIYKAIDILANIIIRNFKVGVNKAHETKQRESGKILISNRNNVKGLEFPFVICVTNRILNSPSYRNSLYTMLTRSFLKSYLVVSKMHSGINEQMLYGLSSILDNKKMVIVEPSKAEQKSIGTRFRYTLKTLSVRELVINVFKEFRIEKEYHEKILKTVIEFDLVDKDEDDIRDFVHNCYKMLKKE